MGMSKYQILNQELEYDHKSYINFELCKNSLIKAMENVEKENREYVKKNN